jgi:adenine-specific DNA-methyltransferase
MMLLENESFRLIEQQRLDQLKTARQRNKLGQFATPPALALDIAKFAWDKVGRRRDNFSFLDPAIGTGAFFAAFMQAFPKNRIAAAAGIELDKTFAETAATIWHNHGL